MNVQTTKDVATQARRVPQRPPIVRYFGDIWDGIATTFLGMRLTIGYFFRKPVTMRYPEVRPVILPGHRGLHTFDESKCTLCHLCQNNCPVNCITVEGLGRARDTLVTREMPVLQHLRGGLPDAVRLAHGKVQSRRRLAGRVPTASRAAQV